MKNYKSRVFLLCLLCKILFFKKCRPKGSNNIFILPTDQPSFFRHLPCRPKINLVLPKGSCVVVWKCEDYITRVEKQLNHKNVYRDVKLKVKSCKILPKQVVTSLEKKWENNIKRT